MRGGVFPDVSARLLGLKGDLRGVEALFLREYQE